MVLFDAQFVKGIQSDNPWWIGEGLGDIPRFRRSDFYYYSKNLHLTKTHILLGPRRCGKTTMIQQIIECLLYEKKADPKRILFVSLDRPYYALNEQKLQDAISYYEEKIIGRSIQDSKEMIYLFVDEAHYDPLWSRVLKQYVDQNLPIYAIVSGSSAAAIYRDQESGAGRFHIHNMVTLKFRDIIRWQHGEIDDKIKTLSIDLREAFLEGLKEKNLSKYESKINEALALPNPDKDRIGQLLDEYLLKGGYPEFYKKTDWKSISRYYQTNVFDVILQKDVVTIANIRQPLKIRSLLVLILQNTARPMTREKIIQKLNLSTPRLLDQYMDALGTAFLVRTSAKFRKGTSYPSTKPRKYYAGDTGMRNSVLGIDNIDAQPEERGALLETAIFNHSLRLLFNVDNQIRTEGYYFEDNVEHDIVLDLRRTYDMVIPLEVKNGHCGDEDIKKMKSSINKLSSPFGIIICSDRIGLIDNVLLVPAWIFLLSC